MKCRGCNTDLVDGDDYRMVADWPFCPSCFEKLMKGTDKPAENPPEISPEEIPAEQAHDPAPVPCSVCKRPLGLEEGQKIGIWTFCPECYADLASFAEMDTPEDDGTVKKTVGGGNPDSGEKATDEAEGGIAGFAVGLSTYVRCTNCGRRIPQGGSRPLEGGSLCPDCYYAVAVKEEPRPPSQAPAPIAPAPGEEPLDEPRDSEDRCDCCDRPLRSGFHEAVEGFTLCRACLSTDSNLAVQIARERHRRLLDRIREGLGSPKPR